MWVKSAQLQNIKGFVDSGVIEFSKGINVLVGPNNAGKSTVVKSVSLLQPIEGDSGYLFSFFQKNVRTGAGTGEVRLKVAEPSQKQLKAPTPNVDFRNWEPEFQFSRKEGSNPLATMLDPAGNSKAFQEACHQREPDNFIYPYFSRRKPSSLQQQISPKNARTIEEVFTNLPSKIDRLLNPDDNHFEAFRKVCQTTLGLRISSVQYGEGKQAGLISGDGALIPIDTMGEGTLNILSVLAHLCAASGNLFLVEELENDIHPKALKPLL